MNKLTLSAITFALLSPISSAFAASGRSDNSGFVVWVFLGFCALIVVAQVVPALMVMLGLVKGATEKQHETAKQKAH
ncbi:MAG: hypothetical protein A2X84_07335 [Desulfuromonadaceae bacterium GWC2_58_13]|nr:MAG: hypothetical protein A2X84_07335 [Desulfuromonadaceae bacterium GWC2_58_13]